MPIHKGEWGHTLQVQIVEAELAGELTVRTGTSTGTVTLKAGHGFADATYTANVYWGKDDKRVSVSGVLTTNALVLSGGNGDDLPVAGIDVTVELAVDCSAATTKTLTTCSPTAVISSAHAASFVNSGTDGKLKYATVSGDMNEAGGQWLVVFSSGKFYTQDFDFMVEPIIE